MTLANPSSTVSDASNSAGNSERFGVRWSLEQTVLFIQQCYDRDALLDTLLGFSQRCLSNRMVLLLGKQQAKPYLLQGWAELDARFRDRSALLGIKVRLAENAPFFDDEPDHEEQLSYALAKRPEDIGIGQLFVDLTLFPPERVVFQTVYIGSYPAIALLGEPLKDASTRARREVQTCARAIGTQLSEVLRLTRADELPPTEERIPTPPLAELQDPEPEEDLYESEYNSMLPGLAVESSISEEILDATPNPGATAYGLPFAKNNTSPRPSAGATAFGLPFVDAKLPETFNRPADDQDVTAHEESTPEEELQKPVNLFKNAQSALQKEPKHTTMEGGFTVDEFAPHSEASVEEASVEKDNVEAASNSPKVEVAPPAEDSSPAKSSGAPKAQILRHISLKKGRKTGNFKAIPRQPPEKAPTQTDPSQEAPNTIPKDMLDRFPGDLQVDRYKYSIPTLPPVQEHSPMLAELASKGRQGVEIAKHFLSHTSIEVRFYATFLFSELPVKDVIELLLERLSDRDQQTRECAKKIVLNHYYRTRARDEDWLGAQLRPFLHAILANDGEDIRTEVAADLLALIRDAQSVDILLEGLERFHGRIKDSVFHALQAITYLDFEPSAAQWKSWRAEHPRGSKTDAEERGEWIVDALNAPSVEIREMVFEEIKQFDRLDLNYHPNQPEKLRARAQEDMRHWLTLYPPE